ncbi:vitamin K epoxide reductase family protein [Rhodococcus sp. PAMC28707]|uniref:vitamin K epoxide reductase family protein n=1 Tax=unclassified Rhodococcus (in: high G+C Gram-positive bacteria) TaxID=192944 RepID=UPI00109D8419|nr:MULTISPECIES: vitamin K epoxide reductase family protein [unclassified Rhodococcus (in: high G+C Gram-positive bacteria)]QCB51310.1 vitamin K epoxide reductase family protein [Rhodococcus sp. PAMC28705]QCB60522.1 vitamin K epoxide reductase family protein [Rhodococcus sp. PAMC28707]
MPSTLRLADLAATRHSKGRPFDRSLPWLLLAGGLTGLITAVVLTVEKFALALDPDYAPTCSMNPVLNCGSVMATPQASTFGFPNSLLGIGGFAVVAAVGAALLAGAAFDRWFWVATQVGVTVAVVFVHWLIVQSLYEIGALCLYCMAVWAVTVPIFWYVTLRNLDCVRSKPVLRRWIELSIRNHSVPLTVWFLAVIALIAQRFWPYWSTLL